MSASSAGRGMSGGEILVEGQRRPACRLGHVAAGGIEIGGDAGDLVGAPLPGRAERHDAAA